MPLTREDRLTHLRDNRLFSAQDTEVLGALSDCCNEELFPNGRFMVREGDAGNGLFIILSGAAEVRHNGATLKALGPGDVFGELAVVGHQPRTAHVIATADTVCLAFPAWEFTALLEKTPALSEALAGYLNERYGS